MLIFVQPAPLGLIITPTINMNDANRFFVHLYFYHLKHKLVFCGCFPLQCVIELFLINATWFNALLSMHLNIMVSDIDKKRSPYF